MKINKRITTVIVTLSMMAGSLSPAAAEPVQAAEYTISVTDFGANGSDDRDDTEAFMQALYKKTHWQREGHVTVKIPAGTYYLSDYIRLSSDMTVDMDAQARIVRLNDSKRMVEASLAWDQNAKVNIPAHDITIKGGIWDGNVQNTKNSKSLFRLANVKNLTFENVTFTNCCGTHFVITAGVENLTVKNCTFSDFVEFTGTEAEYKEQTKSPWSYRGTEALHIDFIDKNNPAKDLAYGQTYQPSTNVEVYNCTFENVTTGLGTHHTYTYMKQDQVKVHDNLFKNCAFYCMDTASYTNFEFYNNTATNVGGLLNMSDTQGKVYNNTISTKMNLTGTMYSHENYNGAKPFLNSVRMDNGSDLEIHHNTIDGTTGNGIYALGKSEFNIHDNKIKNAKMNSVAVAGHASGKINKNLLDKAVLNGISAKEESNIIECSGNTIKNDKEHGLYFTDTKPAKINGNTISNSQKNGIYFSGITGTISRNTISKCKENGILAADDAKVTVTKNKINTNKKCGVMATRGAKVKVSGNTFSKNKLDGYANEKGKVTGSGKGTFSGDCKVTKKS